MEIVCPNCGTKLIRGEQVRYYPKEITVNGEKRQLWVCPRCSTRIYRKTKNINP